MHRVTIHNISMPSAIPIRAVYADSFISRLRGLMFTRSLPEDEGILLVEDSESVINTSIHMLFMNYDITAVWLDKNNCVVDVKLARRWRPAYFPKSPAKTVLELHKDRLEDYHPGDNLSLTYA